VLRECELPIVPKELSNKGMHEVHFLLQAQAERMIKYSLSQCEEYKKRRVEEVTVP
jgi:hypothetical protein